MKERCKHGLFIKQCGICQKGLEFRDGRFYNKGEFGIDLIDFIEYLIDVGTIGGFQEPLKMKGTVKRIYEECTGEQLDDTDVLTLSDDTYGMQMKVTFNSIPENMTIKEINDILPWYPSGFRRDKYDGNFISTEINEMNNGTYQISRWRFIADLLEMGFRKGNPKNHNRSLIEESLKYKRGDK